tara:strand:+ start:8547 stop:9497 length:951 start_codon:yes stop_codon:yes gene_type:complete
MRFKKPKFWDFKKPNFYSYLLLPLTIFVKINNFYLNLKSKKKIKEIKTICVGNIYVGGTGKTPTTIRLYQILKNLGCKVYTAKKYYPNQIDEKIILENQTNLITAKNRLDIIAKAQKKNIKFLIFDDGLQEKKIDYDLKFVCFDLPNWIGNGFLIPAGPLREKLDSLSKYDGVFLKNDSSNKNDQINIIKRYNPNIQIYETYYEPTNIMDFDLSEKYLVFSGIGNHASFKEILIKNKIKVVDEINFPDHFDYKMNDIIKIKDHAKKINAKIITTEKDFVKISNFEKNEIKYLKVKIKISNENQFINFLKSRIYEKN